MMSARLFKWSLAIAALGLCLYIYIAPADSSLASRESERIASEVSPAPAHPLAKKNAGIGSPARVPSAVAQGTLEEFERESSGRWDFQKSSGGFITRLSGGAFALGAGNPLPRLHAFLERYGPALFGFEPGSYVPDVTREADSTQLVIKQNLFGLSVENSQVKFFLDGYGNLIYAVVDVYTGKNPPSPSPVISAEQAAASARAGLLHFLQGAAIAHGADDYPPSHFLRHGELVYRLSAPNSISLVYLYEFPLTGARDDDVRIMVDAKNGGVVMLKSLARR